MEARRLRTALTVGILAVVYFVAAKLSLKLAFLHASASPVWPPAGIALAALLLLGYRVWPAIFVGATASHDSLISDVGLPDGNGMDLLRTVRLQQPIRGIAISGFGMDTDIGKSLEAGFAEHLVKPVKLEKLEAAIARVMAS